MATSVKEVNDKIAWYLDANPDVRLDELIKNTPIDPDKGTVNRSALRRVYKLLETITVARNQLLEEFASDDWNPRQMDIFFQQKE